MSLVQSIRYKCNQCKKAFRYDNQCRCKMCNIKIDAQICLSCHNNNHLIAGIVIALSAGAIILSAKVVQVGMMIIG